MAKDVVWYDSVWLNKYYAAKDIIAEVAPGKLPGFVASFDRLRTATDFTVKDVPGIFDAAALASIKDVIRQIPMATMEMHEMKTFGRFIVHNNPTFTKMQAALTAQVSALAGEDVEPSYNFLSLYTRMGVCEPHLDAPSAKWTLDICIDQSAPWPIHFSQIIPWPEERMHFEGDWQSAIKTSKDLHFRSQELMPGNAILFSGSSQWHYRDAYPQTGNTKSFCDLLFFHYIPKGTAELVKPSNWPRLFDMPELAAIPGLTKAE